MNISQASLTLWQECRRKFQHQVLDNLKLPYVSHPKTEQGSKFHLLMQQRELGLDISHLAATDDQIQSWLHNFERHPPLMIQGDRYAEQTRSFPFNSEYMLTAVYDLLILGQDRAQILDWKTHSHPLSIDILQASWQTRLYLYILAATSNYQPEKISFSYWFAHTGTTVAIAYSSTAHAAIAKELEQIFAEMTTNTYAQTTNQTKCESCGFRYQCERSVRPNLGSISNFPELAI